MYAEWDLAYRNDQHAIQRDLEVKRGVLLATTAASIFTAISMCRSTKLKKFPELDSSQNIALTGLHTEAHISNRNRLVYSICVPLRYVKSTDTGL